MDTYVSFGLVALLAALAGLLASLVGAGLDLRGWLEYRRIIAADHKHAVLEDELRGTLLELEKKVNYRHNLHCPKCGRFAARVEGSDAGRCKHHGIWVRTTVAPVKIEFETHREIAPIQGLRLA